MRHSYVLGLIVLVLGLAAYHTWVVLHSPGYWGVDGGAYILSALHVQGLERTGTDFPRPPLAPGWLLVPFIKAFGDLNGIKLFFVAAAIPLCPAFYLFARLWLRTWPALIATAIVGTDWLLAEMFDAGNLPMLGFALLFIAFWATTRVIQKPHTIAALVLAISLGLIPWVNQTTAGIAAYIYPIYLLASLSVAVLPLVRTVKRDGRGMQYAILRQSIWPTLRRLAVPLLGAFALAIPMLPYYTALTPGNSYTRYPGPLLYLPVTGGYQLWYVAAGLFLGIWLAFKVKAVRPLALTLIALAAILALYSSDESLLNIFYRSRYLAATLIALAGVYWYDRYLWNTPAYVLRFAARFWVYPMAALWVAGFFYQTAIEQHITQMVRPATAEAIDKINADGAPGAVATNSYSMSLYVAALTGRQSPWLQIYDPPPAYRQQHADIVCVMGWTPRCDPQAIIQARQITYVLLDEAWPDIGNNQDISTALSMPSVYRVVTGLRPGAHRHIGIIWLDPCAPWTSTDGVQYGQTKPGVQYESTCDRWAITAASPWLERVYHQDTTTLYRVRKEAFLRPTG